jgi:hypothetical protein
MDLRSRTCEDCCRPAIRLRRTARLAMRSGLSVCKREWSWLSGCCSVICQVRGQPLWKKKVSNGRLSASVLAAVSVANGLQTLAPEFGYRQLRKFGLLALADGFFYIVTAASGFAASGAYARVFHSISDLGNISAGKGFPR